MGRTQPAKCGILKCLACYNIYCTCHHSTVVTREEQSSCEQMISSLLLNAVSNHLFFTSLQLAPAWYCNATIPSHDMVYKRILRGRCLRERRANTVSFDAFTPARAASPPALDGLPMPPLPLACELPTGRLPTLPDLRLVLRPSKLDFAHGALCVRTLREEERQ